ncbi:DCC1-like thiol-disulfide oxidoreductase family protein [Almyronema epifaneia]|uniref:DCC1-like thiol-disulfide oxidoreductase family protein n=1 Tax=Almyronema epifaneia S1 TaxID=2991925 RepID=A0ABW6I9Z1_9CYAN
MTFSRFRPGWSTQLAVGYGLDVRSLALLRLGLAVTLLAVVGAHLGGGATDGVGGEPRSRLIEDGLRLWLSGLPTEQPWLQGSLLVLTAIAALLLLVGYQTGKSAIAAWILVSLLPSHASASLLRGEDWLPSALFWAMFLPLGASYAIDSAMNPQQPTLPKRLFSAATVALMVRQCWVYGFLGGLVWHATALSRWLFVLWWGGLLLLWIPGQIAVFRTVAVGVMGLLTLGLGLAVPADLAFGLSGLTWLAFLPPAVWQAAIQRSYGSAQAGLTIYYDADCGFCKKVVHLLRTFLLLPSTPLLTAQSDPSICADMETQNSWVVVDWQGKRHFKFAAIAYIVSLSPVFRFLAPILRWPPLMATGTRFYETIANNRKAAGRFTQPFKFRSFDLKPPAWVDWTVWGLLAICAIANSYRLFAGGWRG